MGDLVQQLRAHPLIKAFAEALRLRRVVWAPGEAGHAFDRGRLVAMMGDAEHLAAELLEKVVAGVPVDDAAGSPLQAAQEDLATVRDLTNDQRVQSWKRAALDRVLAAAAGAEKRVGQTRAWADDKVRRLVAERDSYYRLHEQAQRELEQARAEVERWRAMAGEQLSRCERLLEAMDRQEARQDAWLAERTATIEAQRAEAEERVAELKAERAILARAVVAAAELLFKLPPKDTPEEQALETALRDARVLGEDDAVRQDVLDELRETAGQREQEAE